MKNYDTIRRELAEAMGWTQISDENGLGIPPRYQSLTDHPKRFSVMSFIPDPLHDPRECEDLEAWLVDQGWRVETWNYGPRPSAMAGCSVYLRIAVKDKDSGRVEHEAVSAHVRSDKEGNPTQRRRRALVEAAHKSLDWQPGGIYRDQYEW